MINIAWKTTSIGLFGNFLFGNFDGLAAYSDKKKQVNLDERELLAGESSQRWGGFQNYQYWVSIPQRGTLFFSELDIFFQVDTAGKILSIGAVLQFSVVRFVIVCDLIYLLKKALEMRITRPLF